MPRRIAVIPLFSLLMAVCLLLPERGQATTFTKLTSDTTSETDASPSPDGRWLAFTSNRGGRGATQIYIMPAEGGPMRQLTHEPDSNRAATPTWAPDGKSLLFVSTRGKRYNIYSIPFEGGDAKAMSEMPGSHRYGTYSRDGSKIAFYSNRLAPTDLFGFNIYVMNASGETMTDLAKQVTNEKGSPGHPTWSADGKWIAYVAKEFDAAKQNTMQGNVLFAKYHIYKVPSTGGKPIQLTSGSIDGQPVEDTWPSWSPDGKWIAYGRQYGLRRDVWLLDVATNKTFPLTTEGICVKPTWSYDGRSVYYSSVIGKNHDLWVARDLTFTPPPAKPAAKKSTAKKPTATKPPPKSAPASKAAPPVTGK